MASFSFDSRLRAVCSAFLVSVGLSSLLSYARNRPLCLLGNIVPQVDGYVDFGFEPVLALLQDLVGNGQEEHVSVCVYHQVSLIFFRLNVQKGRRIVHLHGSATSEPAREYRQMVFSTTKVASALTIAVLVQRGLLSYDAPISQYWPEFAQHGKEDITVAQLLTHQAGLSYLTSAVPKEIMRDYKKLGDWLAAQPLTEDPKVVKGPNPPRAYHACSRGLFLSQLVHRVDPKKRTLGEFFREEIAIPYGLDMYIGNVPKDVEQTVRPLKLPHLGYFLFKAVPDYLIPFWSSISSADRWMVCSLLWPWSPTARSISGVYPTQFRSWGELNSPHFFQLELPSSSGVATSEALARLAHLCCYGWVLRPNATSSAQSCPGEGGACSSAESPTDETDKLVLLDEQTLALAHKIDENEPLFDHLFRKYTTFMQMGVGDFGMGGWYGWHGIGGSVSVFHPETGLALGYTPTLVGTDVAAQVDLRAVKIADTVLRCFRTLCSTSDA